MDVPRDDVKRRRFLRRLLFGIVALGVAAGVGAVALLIKPALPQVDANSIWFGTVQRGDLAIAVTGHGRLAPKRLIWVTAGAGGRVEAIAVEPGESVEPGDALITLRSPTLELEAREAEAECLVAEKEMAIEEASRDMEHARQEAAIATARAEYAKARKDAENDTQLFKDKLVSRTQMEISDANVDARQAHLKAEERVLALMDATSGLKLSASQARLEQNRASLELKRNQLAGLEVRASLAGVVRQVDIETGQEVAAGANLALIVQTGDLKAEIRVPETQAKDIALGQTAMIDMHTAVMEGSVRRISPAVHEGTVAVDVEFSDPLPDGARPDLSVTGTIQLHLLEDVLHVDRPAFAVPEGPVQVFRTSPDGRTARRVTAKFGRHSTKSVEVVEGLGAGDRIVLSDLSDLLHLEEIALD
ncbi:MAG: HlyD family efflux transporter periplasmic adaptor subunit [bacterium]|nr:HlyD family efflux transporter periplasmic adaptor subunit [bacterium]